MIKFRPLTARETECRIGQVSNKGVMLLIYKNARADMTILDECVKAENWQREHYEVKGNLYCRVGINRNHDKPDAPAEWIWKSDCGTESNTEAQKGESSDSFKRACVNWGIGRELYTAPFIWIEAKDCNIKESGRQDRHGNPVMVCYDNFFVREMIVENGEIVCLVIYNAAGNVRKNVFEYDKRRV